MTSSAPEAPVATGSALGLSLRLDAAIDVPGLTPADARSARSARVRVDPEELRERWRAVAHGAERVRELRDGDALVLAVDHAPPAGYLLDAPGFARVLVAGDGSELLCDPEPGSEEWTTPLLAQALPLAATLQGLEVLHASGVRMGDGPLAGRAALFSGPQGAGKSSLAAALVRRGATLLSDDTVAIEQCEGALLAHGGPALLQLREQERERLSDQERAALGPETRALGRHRFAAAGACASAGPASAAPVPFGALLLLERATDGPLFERLRAVDPFALLACTFNLSVRSAERLTRHLDLAVALAATQRIYRVRVQPGVDATQLADALLERLPEP
jgi:hypothetical protein